MVTSAVLLQEQAASRPNFAAPIYGGPFGKMPAIPSNLPSIFLAWAQDDPSVVAPVVKFYEALKSAGQKPEVHIYSAGGHAFGMKKQALPANTGFEEFYNVFDAQEFAKLAAKCATVVEPGARMLA